MTHGPEYKTNGKRPVWLKDGDGFLVKYCFLDPFTIKVCDKNDWSFVEYIRLPADHWANRAIEAGYEPFAGGDEAPDDWTGNERDVIYLDGQYIGRHPSMWVNCNVGSDIIGYKKKEIAVSENTTTYAPEGLDTWAIEEAMNECGHDKGLIPHSAIYALARLIQKHEPHRKPKDRDQEIAEKWVRKWIEWAPGGITSLEKVVLSAIKEAKA